MSRGAPRRSQCGAPLGLPDRHEWDLGSPSGRISGVSKNTPSGVAIGVGVGIESSFECIASGIDIARAETKLRESVECVGRGAAGFGVETWDPFQLIDAPVKIDLFGQLHSLQHGALIRESETPVAGYPRDGTTIPYGGLIGVFGGQIGFDYH